MTPPCSITRRQAWRWSMAMIVALALLSSQVRSKPKPLAAAIGTQNVNVPPAATIIGTSHVNGVSYSPDGRFLVLLTPHTNTVTVLRLPGLRLHRELPYPIVQALGHPTFCQGSKWVAAAGHSDYVWVWNNETGALRWKWPVYSVGMIRYGVLSASPKRDLLAIGPVSESPDGTKLDIWQLRGTAEIRRLSTGRVTAQLAPPKGFDGGYLTELQLTSDGHHLIGGSPGGRIWMWDVRTGKVMHDIRLQDSMNVMSLSPDERLLAAAESHNRGRTHVSLCDPWKGRVIKRLQGWKSSTDIILLIRALAFSPDGKHLAAGDNEGRLAIWQVKTGKLVRELHLGKKRRIYCLSYSPDGKSLAVGHERGLSIWKTADLLGD